MYDLLRSYTNPALSAGFYGLQTAGTFSKNVLTLTVSHFFLNLMSNEKSNILDTAFYLITRNVIPLVCTKLLPTNPTSHEEENPAVTLIKHSIIPTLCSMIFVRCITSLTTTPSEKGTPPKEASITWHHVIGLEILKRIRG